MKVILIQPSSPNKRKVFLPIGLGYLASCLEQAGHKVKIIYSSASKQGINELKNEIKIFNPDVVGITATTIDIFNVLETTKVVKEYDPNCLTILGGPHPTVTARETLKMCSDVDVIVRGEGERTLTELLEKKDDFASVRGISFRSNGRIIENKDREVIRDLDSLPFPAFHLLPMEKYKTWGKLFNMFPFESHGIPYGSILTSRGCPFGCVFCSSCRLWGRKWRVRSSGNVVEELKILRDKYGKKYIDFLDDTFTLDKNRVLKICRLIKEEDIDITWECAARVDLFDKEIATALKKAGCIQVYLGIESGVQKTLDFLNKGLKIENSVRAVKIAKNVGLKVESNFVIGVPGETKEMINKTISFAKKLDLDSSSFTILTPFPGTELYEIAEKNNLLFTKDWDKYQLTGSVMKVPGLTQRELKGLYLKANFSLNLSLSRIFKYLIKEISIKRVKENQ